MLVKQYYLLLVILILAGILRFWSLSSNPPGLTWDEAALGYNAYSIWQTGKDEYGAVLPLNLKSFGDFKPAVYAYLDVPFVAILGLNEFAVRLPSVIFGIATVALIYFLVKALFKNEHLALFSSFFLTISPWHIQFSRPAFEANVALFLNLLGTYLFIRGLNQKKLFLWGALVWGIALFTYQGSRVFLPILVAFLIISFRKGFIGLSIFTIFLIILFFSTFLTGQTSRLMVQNLFAYQRSPAEITNISKEDGLNKSSFEFQVLHGEWWTYTKGLAERYLIYFSPKMLFIDGEASQRHRVPDLGALYYFSAVLIPLGIVYFVKFSGLGGKVLLAWILLAPMPAVLSRDLISLLRALNMVVPLAILEGGGLFLLLNFAKKLTRKWFYIFLALTTVVIALNFLIYLDRYFIHAPKEYSKYWLYGYRQVLEEIKPLMDQYQKVIISDSYGQPYIYYLFYSKYPPEKFQKQAILDQPTVDVGTVRRIDSIEFRHIYWPSDRGLKNTLFVGPEEELPDKDILPFKEFKVLKEINFLNGERALKIVETL